VTRARRGVRGAASAALLAVGAARAALLSVGAASSALLAVGAGCVGLATAGSRPAAAQQGDPAAGGDTLIVMRSVGPNLEFLPDRISVRQGTRVTLRYVNDGELPHNFALVRDEDSIDALARAAYEAAGNGFVPADMEDDLIAYSSLLPPGRTVDIEFVAPPAGEYTYICLFPGHANMMLGTLRSLR